MSAMRACGLSGYRSDGDFTLGRHLRDVLSSPIMINNDRILREPGDACADDPDSDVAARLTLPYPASPTPD